MRNGFIAIIVFLIAWFLLSTHTIKEDKVSLGQRLFHDPILSEDLSVSCASCHKPAFAFADTSALSIGVHGRLGTRNTPSVMNMLNRDRFFWDGRAATLMEQALFPIENPMEMNLPIAIAVQRLNNNRLYVSLFQEVFNELPNAKNLGLAIAAFQETLESGNSANDQWITNDDSNAISLSAIRGREVFMLKGKCFDCHFTPDFTGDEFRNIGLFDGVKSNDSGHYLFSKIQEDMGKFKVPGLRNVAITAPYMHDGRFKTLREVIDYYDHPKKIMPMAVNIDSLMEQPLNLTEQEKVDLEEFLKALTDPQFTHLLSKH